MTDFDQTRPGARDRRMIPSISEVLKEITARTTVEPELAFRVARQVCADELKKVRQGQETIPLADLVNRAMELLGEAPAPPPPAFPSDDPFSDTTGASLAWTAEPREDRSTELIPPPTTGFRLPPALAPAPAPAPTPPKSELPLPSALAPAPTPVPIPAPAPEPESDTTEELELDTAASRPRRPAEPPAARKPAPAAAPSVAPLREAGPRARFPSRPEEQPVGASIADTAPPLPSEEPSKTVSQPFAFDVPIRRTDEAATIQEEIFPPPARPARPAPPETPEVRAGEEPSFGDDTLGRLAREADSVDFESAVARAPLSSAGLPPSRAERLAPAALREDSGALAPPDFGAEPPKRRVSFGLIAALGVLAIGAAAYYLWPKGPEPAAPVAEKVGHRPPRPRPAPPAASATTPAVTAETRPTAAPPVFSPATPVATAPAVKTPVASAPAIAIRPVPAPPRTAVETPPPAPSVVTLATPVAPGPPSPGRTAAPAAGPSRAAHTATVVTSDRAGKAPVFSVHFSSYPDRANAAKEAGALARKLGVPGYAAEVDLGAKGTWYRVMVGEFETLEDAQAFRAQVEARAGTAEGKKLPKMGWVYRLVGPTP